jgi:hypothetical protein
MATATTTMEVTTTAVVETRAVANSSHKRNNAGSFQLLNDI